MYNSISEVHTELLGGYISRSFKHYVFSFKWNRKLAEEMIAINPKRALKRITSYVSDTELKRVQDKTEFSIRCGMMKTGRGHFGERGDFCMIGMSYSKKVLTIHYRSLELFGGLVYDQAIIIYVQDVLGLEIKTIVNMCASCHSFALKRNSNEKLYEKLLVIYRRLGYV